jgi:hypothetical protein
MAVVVFLLPAVYEASATLLIEKSSLPVELSGGADAQEYVEQRLQRARQRVLTDENVQSLIERHHLYASDALEDQLVEFDENVLITPQVTGVIDPQTMRAAELTYAFDVGFRDSNPEMSQIVANELAGLFVAASSAQAKEEADRAVEFAKVEAETARIRSCASGRPGSPSSGSSIPADFRKTAFEIRNGRCHSSVSSPWSMRTCARHEARRTSWMPNCATRRAIVQVWMRRGRLSFVAGSPRRCTAGTGRRTRQVQRRSSRCKAASA